MAIVLDHRSTATSLTGKAGSSEHYYIQTIVSFSKISGCYRQFAFLLKKVKKKYYKVNLDWATSTLTVLHCVQG